MKDVTSTRGAETFSLPAPPIGGAVAPGLPTDTAPGQAGRGLGILGSPLKVLLLRPARPSEAGLPSVAVHAADAVGDGRVVVVETATGVQVEAVGDAIRALAILAPAVGLRHADVRRRRPANVRARAVRAEVTVGRDGLIHARRREDRVEDLV